ncbi:MAG: shikimate kinase AroK [Gammaproteobacteria bacterium]|nr:shikimate kinase AroK [Gammaproteobacteria bacterium]
MLRNIILIGPMGAGKSSVGKRLARQLNRKFYDCDKVLEERTGVTITTIFELEGEQGFRQRETKILQELTDKENSVIATGGGVILLSENIKLLSTNSIVVYLSACVNSQIKRTRHDKKRPLLQTQDRHATLQNLANTRNPIYRELADIIIDTDAQSISSSIEQIIAHVNNIKN